MCSATHHPRPSARLIDTHAHLDSYEDVDGVLGRAEDAGVFKLIAASFSFHSSSFSADLASKRKNVYAAVGVHPNNASELDDEAKEVLRLIAKQPDVKAIGETGLDYYRDRVDKDTQLAAFKWHLDLAKDLDLPVIIHSRDALDDSLDLLEREGWPKKGLVFHAFAGNIGQAKRIISAGGLISVTGVVTFKNAPELQQLVRDLPLEKIMIETDSPYLSPEPFRGKTNEPVNVVKVAEKIADLKNISVEEVALQTTKTAEEFFGI